MSKIVLPTFLEKNRFTITFPGLKKNVSAELAFGGFSEQVHMSLEEKTEMI